MSTTLPESAGNRWDVRRWITADIFALQPGAERSLRLASRLRVYLAVRFLLVLGVTAGAVLSARDHALYAIGLGLVSLLLTLPYGLLLRHAHLAWATIIVPFVDVVLVTLMLRGNLGYYAPEAALLYLVPIIAAGFVTGGWTPLAMALLAGIGYLIQVSVQDPGQVVVHGIRVGLFLAMAVVTWAFSTTMTEALMRTDEALAERTRERDLVSDQKAREGALIQAFERISNRIIRAESLQALHDFIVSEAAVVLGAEHCSIGLYDDTEQCIVTAAASRVSPDLLVRSKFKLGEGVAGLVAQGKVPILIGDASRDPRFKRLGERKVASVLSVPLLANNIVIGTMTATSSVPKQFTGQDMGLLATFGNYAAIAIQNADLYQQMDQEKRELEAVLSGIGDAVVVCDEDMQVVLFNRIAYTLLADPADENGDPVPLIALSEDHPLAPAVQQTFANPGQRTITDVDIIDPETRRLRSFQALSALIPRHEDSNVVVTILRDFTAARNLEQAKDALLANITHELKTPLNSIRGFLDIVLQERVGQVTEIQRDFLSTAQEESTHLLGMINDILDLSRIQAGGMRLESEPLALHRLCDQVITSLRPISADKGVIIINEVLPALPPVRGDWKRLIQVLTNLVENGLKFTPEAGTITIRAREDDDYMRVSISDTGIGIPAEVQERIFEAFFQVNSKQSENLGGVGLGLAICRYIVEGHRGNIWVEGAEGQGATFHFTVPIWRDVEDAAEV